MIITLILGIATIEEKHEPEKVPVDIWGIIFIMLTFLGLVYGFANIAAFGENPVVEIAALVAAAQMQKNSFSYEQKTAAGSTHGFIFLLILAVVCLILQIVGFKNYEKTEEQ